MPTNLSALLSGVDTSHLSALLESGVKAADLTFTIAEQRFLSTKMDVTCGAGKWSPPVPACVEEEKTGT